ncbi:hypothetical protein [Thalassotalea marina]|uniref:YkuD domain-containing protein n=1 Tax=Thalassotalea marina TaxID=1673741 RepID=A0A919BCH0_9GAMM|nr:hypothetical protein [Thalassotalea marina]GHF82474.1 hypothetical protein GCM10017161_07060 [Thalassotalea marina]
MDKETINKSAWIVGGILLFSGIFLAFGEPSFQFQQNWSQNLQSRLALMMAVAVLIERSVEVYLNSHGLNGNSAACLSLSAKNHATQIIAAKASLILGVLAAFAGVRLMDVFGIPVAGSATTTFILRSCWYGIDVVISGGLLAGGAAIFHEIINILQIGLARIKALFSVSETPSSRNNGPLDVTPDKYYTIDVVRESADSGTLRFQDGSTNIETPCWWEGGKEIEARIYKNCSKTVMATKGYISVYIKGATTPGSTVEDIFIHKGTSPSASDGCIVIRPSEMSRLYNAINPSNGHNVTINVTDK